MVMHGEKELLNEPNHNDMFSGSTGFGTDRLHAGGQQSCQTHINTTLTVCALKKRRAALQRGISM